MDTCLKEMQKLKFTYDKSKAPLIFIKGKKRYSIKTVFKDGTTINKKNITEATAWGIVRSTVEPKAKLTQKLLGAEWAAIRAHQGASPLIVPMMRGGNWIYIERKNMDEYELRIVEPLGTKRTTPKRVTGKEVDKIIFNASRRDSKEKEKHEVTLTH